MVITDLGVLEPDPHSRELTLTRLHPGVDVEQVRAATGWPLAVSPDVATEEPPAREELEVLRALQATLDKERS
jgi:glutaconate CoA-transferase subunit B